MDLFYSYDVEAYGTVPKKKKQEEKRSPEEIKNANKKAQILLTEIETANGDLNPAYKALQGAVDNYRQSGGHIEDLLPAGLGGSGLGIALFKRGKTGEGFWISFLYGIRSDLCNKNGDLRKYLKDGVQISTTAVIAALVATVSLPLAFIPPIAALLVSRGIDYWCRSSNNE